ncbi:MAG: T9SS type A sorting domain-containing protein [Bacteroidetes bacterium]|nr:T9SS type A sorting domain-containing protein [Bacteroidota bacterium]
MDRYIRLHLTIICLLIVGSSSAANYYWIGGSGNWNDLPHWSSTSGGIATYSNPPSPNDDVFIDNNSGFSAGDSLNLWFQNDCHSLTIDSLPFNFKITSISSSLTIYGDITISSPVDFINARIEFVPISLTSNIYAPYTSFYQLKVPIANCTLNLLSTLSLKNSFEMIYTNSHFNSNNHDLYVTDFNVGFATQMNLGTSNVYFIDCNATWSDNNQSALQNTNFFILGSSVIFDGNFRANKVFIDYQSDVGFSDIVHIREMTCSGYLDLQDFGPKQDTINKLIMNNGVYFYTLVTDTLIFNITQSTSYALVFDELTINDYFEVNAVPGGEILMTVYSTIAYASLYMNMPLACLDFLAILDVNIIGTGLYYAGANSSGIGLNWIWSGCAPTYHNVWPGDANDDLIVNHHDFLFVGLGNTSTGAPRDSISNYYAANYTVNWSSNFPNAVNFNNADCNGDSTINADDTLAIVQNYGISHPAVAPINAPLPLALLGTKLTLDLPGLLSPGVAYTVPIVIGDSVLNNLEMHGLAFSLLYDTSFIDASTVDIQFGSSWFALPGQSINFKRNFSSLGKIDFAMTRFNGVDALGGGRIAWLKFTVKNNVSGNTNFQFEQILAVNSQMKEIVILSGNFPIGTTVSIDEFISLSDQSVLYPNPATEFISLILPDPTPIIHAEIFSIYGTLVLAEYPQAGTPRLEMNIKSLKPGVYFLRAKRKDFSIIEKRFVVQ